MTVIHLNGQEIVSDGSLIPAAAISTWPVFRISLLLCPYFIYGVKVSKTTLLNETVSELDTRYGWVVVDGRVANSDIVLGIW